MCFKIPFRIHLNSLETIWKQVLECFGLNEEQPNTQQVGINDTNNELEEVVVMSPKTEMGFEIINNTY